MTIPTRLTPLLTLALALALLTLSAPTTARGASVPGQGVSITGVEAGYEFGGGGAFRLNGPSALRPGGVWIPVRVTLRNNGGDNVAGRVVVSVDGAQNGSNGGGPTYRTDYTSDVTLAPGAIKRVTLLAPAANAGLSLTAAVEAGGRVVDARPVALTPQQGGVLSVGVLSDDAAAGAALRAVGKLGDTTLSVARFTAAAPLDPQPAALDNFDLIVLSNNASDTLTSAQFDALRAWVAGGGTLLVAGGTDARKTMASLPPDLLAATFQSVGSASALPELARLSGDPVAARGPVAYSVATARPGAAVLAAHGGVPLAVAAPLGRGYLVYSAVEPDQSPLQGWPLAAQGDFWARLLTRALVGPRDALLATSAQSGAGPQFASAAPSLQNLTNDLGTATTRGLPAPRIYVFLIILYVLILGPVNYILLRWRRRLEWSWITIPVLAALFGLGSFGLAYARNGGDVVANTDRVVYLDPGVTVKTTDAYIGLLSPVHGDVGLSTSGRDLVWGLGNDSASASGGGNGGGNGGGSAGGAPGMSVAEGSSPTARLVGLQLWTQRNVGVRQEIALPGAIAGNLTVSGSSVGGTVTNTTGVTLHDAYLVAANGASAIIPTLAAGATARVAPFGLGGTSAGTNNAGILGALYSGSDESKTLVNPSRYSAILGTVFPAGSVATPGAPLALVGWSKEQLGAFAVNGSSPRRSDLDLFVAPLSPTLARGRFTLAPGAAPVGAIGTTVRQTGAGGAGLTLNAGDSVDVGLTLPPPAAGRQIHVDTLTLQATPNGASLGAQDARLWDWTVGAWRPVDLSGGALTLRSAGLYVSSGGRVLLRVQAPQSGNLSFNNVDQNFQIGAQGSVR